MLDAIADFWKPVKRLQAQSRLKSEELQMGSVVGFGFVPQPSLSGRRLTVTAINTYKFGPDILTSFVLSQDKDAGASMIIADAGGEQYIAMSRRISISDRNKLFVHEDIEAVIKSEEAPGIHCREVTPEYKGWIAPHYKRELFNVKGQLYKGDHRAGLVIGASALDFAYTLLVSDNNEHALEIERYEDGRVEVYATVYRRMSDVGEVSHPNPKDKEKELAARPDVKLVSNGTAPAFEPEAKPAPKLGESTQAVPEKKMAFEAKPVEAKAPEAPKPQTTFPEAKAPEVKAPEVKTETKTEVKTEAVTTPVKLPEFPAAAVAPKAEAPKQELKVEVPKAPEAPKVEAPKPEFIRKPVEEKPAAPAQASAPAPQAPIAPQAAAPAPAVSAIVTKTASAPTNDAPVKIQASTQPYIQQEIKAVNKETSNFVNESIDCELQVANRIIDEAIRQEMRINDVVRKVIGLPVSAQESVQIPVTLTDQDYALLAIRYGISASDHDAIKRKITEDLADFSGANRQKKAA